MIGTFRRWVRDEYRALNRLGHGKTAGERFDGLHRSNRNEAKFLLLAMAPVVPLMASDGLGYDRSLVWYLWAGLAGVWFILISGSLAFFMFKAAINSRRGRG